MYRVLLILTLVGAAVPQLILNKPCEPSQNTMPVDFNQFAGTWYQIERIPNSEEVGDCSTLTYEAPTISSGNSGLLRSREIVNETVRVRNGRYISYDHLVGTWLAGFEREGTPEVTVTWWHYMLHTDNSMHALIYSCRDSLTTLSSSVFAWKLSKSTSLSNDSMAAIQDVIRNHEELRHANWRVTDHSETACAAGSTLNNPPLLALIALFIIT